MSQVRCVLVYYQRAFCCVDILSTKSSPQPQHKLGHALGQWYKSVSIKLEFTLSISCATTNTGHVVYSYQEDVLGCFPDSD